MQRTEQDYLKSLHNRELSVGVRQYVTSGVILCEQRTEIFFTEKYRCHRYSTVILRLIADMVCHVKDRTERSQKCDKQSGNAEIISFRL